VKTVIVRVFEPAPDTGPVALRGLVEDVRTGSANPFQGSEQLLAAIVAALDNDGDLPAEEPAKPVGPDRGSASYR
jgi:hypothetical protein